jgi:hypothetical protein
MTANMLRGASDGDGNKGEIPGLQQVRDSSSDKDNGGAWQVNRQPEWHRTTTIRTNHFD